MRKTILVLAVGALVVAGAAAAFAQTDEPEPPPAVTDEHDGHDGHRPLTYLLEEAVAEGIIDQDQADALAELATELKAEFREQRQAARELLREFWEDEVLTEAEIAQLPEWHPLHRVVELTDAFDDGQITKDELQELRRDFRPAHRFRGGLDRTGVPGV